MSQHRVRAGRQLFALPSPRLGATVIATLATMPLLSVHGACSLSPCRHAGVHLYVICLYLDYACVELQHGGLAFAINLCDCVRNAPHVACLRSSSPLYSLYLNEQSTTRTLCSPRLVARKILHRPRNRAKATTLGHRPRPRAGSPPLSRPGLSSGSSPGPSLLRR